MPSCSSPALRPRRIRCGRGPVARASGQPSDRGRRRPGFRRGSSRVTVPIAGRAFRQLFIQDLGHDQPTILLTNQRRPTDARLITRYAQRMLIENALSSTVGLKVDFDMALLVIASGLYRLLARRMRGYADAQARQIFRDLLDMPADVTIAQDGVHVTFHRRAHLPIIVASGLLDKPVAIPWWKGLPLQMSA